ncbi:glycine oxidase ThiO [Paenibacillus sp. y28]|uniref:glycine oxidase ThiO n=1 Tax=Paenibacillus sp. y28 TaxID=3129110 RepID=UPI003015EF6F
MNTNNQDQSTHNTAAGTSAIVVGGGIIGGAIALELRLQGADVTLLDAGRIGGEASGAAAGMLGAHVEIHKPGPFFDLCRYSLGLYKDWTDQLAAWSGISPQYIPEGIVRLALDEEDELEVKGRESWIQSGRARSTEELRQLEPKLTSEGRGGLYFESDHQIQPVQLMASLADALRNSGCQVLEHTPVLSLLTESDLAGTTHAASPARKQRVIGVRTPQGTLQADYVIVAAGSWSSSLFASVNLRLPVTPVKGQCISVRPRKPQQRPAKTVFTKGCYVVPKSDGTVLIGASQEHIGYDKALEIPVINRLYNQAIRLVPDLQDAEFVSTWAGLRPATPDELPYLGHVDSHPGLIAATGHYRNGILLAPATGRLIADLIMGREPAVDLAPYAPNRVYAGSLSTG